MAKDKGGRPTVVTKHVLRKLEEAFSWGCTDREAFFHANIASATFYAYQKDNPEFKERKEELKENPVLLARKSVVDSLEKDPNLALKYLERKKKAEFAPQTRVDLGIGKTVEIIKKQFDGSEDEDN